MELLVTTSLMVLVGGATVASLSGGLRVWERAQAFGMEHQETLIGLEQLRRGLQGVRRFTPIPFEGSYQQCAFAAAGRDQPEGELSLEIGRLGYFLNERQHLLCRSFVPYRLMTRQQLTSRCEAVLTDVIRLRFRYFGDETGEGSNERWASRWRAPEPPVALQGEVTIQKPNRPPQTHTFLIPLVSQVSVKPEEQRDPR